MASGVINSYIPKDQLREIDPEKETAAGQMTNILSSDNPLMKQAETAAKQEASRRGVLNSAMATQAGQGAVLSVAAPLASEAAGAYREQAARNQGISSQYGLNQQQIEASAAAAEKGYGYQTGLNQQQIDAATRAEEARYGYSKGLSQQQIEASAAAAEKGAEYQAKASEKAFDYHTKLNTQQADIQKSMANLDQENKVKFADIEMAHQKTLQTNSSAMTLYQNTIAAVSQISSNPDLSPAQQQQGVTSQYKMLEQGLKLIGTIPPDSIDFTGNTDQSSTPIGEPAITAPKTGESPGSYVGETRKVVRRIPNNEGELVSQYVTETWNGVSWK